MQIQAKTTQNLDRFTRRKVQVDVTKKSDANADSLEVWMESYLVAKLLCGPLRVYFLVLS